MAKAKMTTFNAFGFVFLTIAVILVATDKVDLWVAILIVLSQIEVNYTLG